MSGRSDPATIVIDLGDTAIRAAVVTGEAPWLVPEPVTGAASWPAAAHWSGGQLRIGALAERERSADPDGYWSELKRCLTVDAAVSQGGRTFRPIELITAVLVAVVSEARRRYGGPIERALLTVPASYHPGSRHRACMISAAEAAGLDPVELLVEPVASAGAFDAIRGGLVLVCDVGGGSIDWALVRVGGAAGPGADPVGEPEVLGTDSLDGAGREVDARLERRIFTDGREWLAPLIADMTENPGTPSAVRLGLALTDFARRLKHRLSDAPVVQDMMLATTPPYRLTREDLAGVVAPVLERAVLCGDRLLRRLGFGPADLDAVLLAGGGARIESVAARLTEAFGRAPERLANPELTVVHGAVRWLVGRDRPVLGPEQLPAGVMPLAFAIPGGGAHLVRWLVGPGQRYGSGATLARVRLSGGGLWDLTATGPGVLDRVLVAPDAEVSAHQWLALAAP